MALGSLHVVVVVTVVVTVVVVIHHVHRNAPVASPPAVDSNMEQSPIHCMEHIQPINYL
jgi:hypothetical protein